MLVFESIIKQAFHCTASETFGLKLFSMWMEILSDRLGIMAYCEEQRKDVEEFKHPAILVKIWKEHLS